MPVKYPYLLEIAYPFPNFPNAIPEFIPHFIMDIITYSYWDKFLSILLKGVYFGYYSGIKYFRYFIFI